MLLLPDEDRGTDRHSNRESFTLYVLRCTKVSRQMDAPGHQGHFEHAAGTSGLPPTSDISLRRSERRDGPCVDGSELARRIFTSQAWSVQPCVRPLSAVHMTAGHNALRGSGPGHKLAFENAVARVGCPDRRIDRLCITCCSPSQPSHHAMVLGAISSDPQRGWIIVSLAPSHHCPGHSGELVGQRDGGDFGRPSCQQRCDPGPILGAVESWHSG